MSHFKYSGEDKDEYSAYLPSDQHTYPVSYQPKYKSMNYITVE